MVIDLTDQSVINDITLDESHIRVIAWYNVDNDELKEIWVNDSWSIKTIAWIGWNLVNSDLTNNVWGIQKSTEDLSLFHWLWTYNIPQSAWHITENGTLLANNDTSTQCYSNVWQMEIDSWGTLWNITELYSRRHPRYQPNRWHYFATAWYIPTPDAIWIRKWGLKSNWNGVYFTLVDWILYGYMLNTSWESKLVALDLPEGTDLSKWNLYDIQYQWRWVWNYYFYFNLKLAWVITNLWGWSQVSIANPALSVYFSCENTDWTEVSMVFGCCDVTSEWGQKEWLTYASCSNELTVADPQWVSVSILNQPLIIMRVKETLYWEENTRDSLVKRISASSDQKSVMKMWFTRDITAFGWTAFIPWNFQDSFLWSSIEYIDWVWTTATTLTFDTTKAQKVFGGRVKLDDTLIIENPANDIDFFIEQWDYIVLTWEREWGWNAKMFWNIESGEEI